MMSVIGQELEATEDPAMEFRALFVQAMRENINQKVQDGLLGAGEALIHLIPRALAVMAKDLESPDPLEKSRAAQFLLKYAINFKEDEPAKDKDNGVITIVADRVLAPGQVVYKAPDTPFGQAYLDEIQAPTPHMLTDPDMMRTCYKCKESKHKDAVYLHDYDNGNPDTPRYLCKACSWAKKQKQDKVVDLTTPDAVVDF